MWIRRIASNLMGVAPALALSLVLFGCVTTQRQQPTAPEMQDRAAVAFEHYRIGPNDSLQITVWANPEVSVPEVVVRPDGKISFPLLDDVAADGLTPLELKQVLTDGLSEYITAPTVTVVVRDIRSKMVYVLGEVARPGPIAMHANMTLVDALSVAGGPAIFADRDQIKVIRVSADGNPVEFGFDYDAYVDGTDLGQNIRLVPGDKIVVP